MVAAKRLPSGDLRLTLNDTAAQGKLEAVKSWGGVIGESATVTAKLFPVVVHGVRIQNVDTNNPEAPKNIEDQCKPLYSNVKFARIAWLRKDRMEGKTHSSLIIHLRSAAMANLVIEKGVLIDSEFHEALYYDTTQQITQCFNCQAYGHIGPHCGKPIKCGTCAGDHNTRSCTSEENRKCANCNKKHPAWSADCKMRIAAKQRAQFARAQAPLFHPVATAPKNNEWHLVSSGKKRNLDTFMPTAIATPAKRPVGRPPKMSQPNPPSQRTLFTQTVESPAATQDESDEEL